MSHKIAIMTCIIGVAANEILGNHCQWLLTLECRGCTWQMLGHSRHQLVPLVSIWHQPVFVYSALSVALHNLVYLHSVFIMISFIFNVVLALANSVLLVSDAGDT